MACFLVPLTEAVVVSVVKGVALKKNNASETVKIAREKVGVLQKLLYGGSFLLAAEHIYHGEVTFLPPFLTAMTEEGGVPVMLHEMATVGVAMAVLVTAVWGIWAFVSSRLAKRAGKKLAATEA